MNNLFNSLVTSIVRQIQILKIKFKMFDIGLLNTTALKVDYERSEATFYNDDTIPKGIFYSSSIYTFLSKIKSDNKKVRSNDLIITFYCPDEKILRALDKKWND